MEIDVRDMFPKGTLVNVRGNPDCQDFTGTVVDHRPSRAGWHGVFITVRDQNDDCFDCMPSELFMCSDDAMQ